MSIISDIKLQYKSGDITIKLIFWNVILFLVPTLAAGILQIVGINFPFSTWIALPSLISEFIQKPWTLITYSFFHNNLLHLVFNMLMLHFVGRLFTTFFTQKQFLGLYLLGGIFSGVCFILGYTYLPILSGQFNYLIGSSASIMTLLFATTMYQPDYNLRIPLIGNVKLWHIVLVMFFLMFVANFNIANLGSQLSHLCGAIFGFLYIKLLKNGIDLTSGLNSFIDSLANLFSIKKTTPFKKVYKNGQSQTPKTQQSNRTITKDKTQQQIDEILDKISQSGYDSLTKEEKEFLFKAGNNN